MNKINENSKLKRILAGIAAALLVGLYIFTLVCAFFANGIFKTMFLISAVSTIAVPVMIHLFLMLRNVRKGKSVMSNTYVHQESSQVLKRNEK